MGDRRDLTWALLTAWDLQRRDASDPDFPGVPVDAPERHEASRILNGNWRVLLERNIPLPLGVIVFESRVDALERAGERAPVMAFWTGEYAQALASVSPVVAATLQRGQLGLPAMGLSVAARCHSALGNLGASHEAFGRATELAERIGNPPILEFLLEGVRFDHTCISGEGYKLHLAEIERLLAEGALQTRQFRGMVWAWGAFLYAQERRREEALRAVKQVLPVIERAPVWALYYTGYLYWVVEALWVLDCCDHADVLERNLREKTLVSDFRYCHTDARLAMARLCALTGRVNDAREWFDKAREVLDEQGARPLRAITDFDEAWMEVRRGTTGDRERALALLAAARGPFESIGMPGWLRRVEELRQQLER